jgi:hypothetical protein
LQLVIPKDRISFSGHFDLCIGCWICVDLHASQYEVNNKLKGEMMGKAGAGCFEIMLRNSIGETEKCQENSVIAAGFM